MISNGGASIAVMNMTRNTHMSINIVERMKMKMKKIEYRMGLGMPRGSKVIVRAGERQADITLIENADGHTWRVKIDRDLPETEYPTLENAILSAETLFREVV
jgi:ribosomal protein L16/L10AE